MKIMGIVDRHGMPLAVSTHAANHHEVTLVQLSFDFYMIEAKPENLIGDKAHDSDKRDAELKDEGVEMNAPHRQGRRKRKTRMAGSFAATNGAGSSNGFFAWLQWQRRLITRWEYYAVNFLGFVQLASVMIPLRRF